MSFSNDVKVEQKHFSIPISSSLPMEKRTQSALLGHLIQNEKLFIQASRKIQPNWFVDPYHKKIYEIMLKGAEKVGRPLNRAELEESPDLLAEDVVTKNKILAYVTMACSDSTQIRWDAIRPQLTDWLQSKILQDTIVKSSNLWNRGQWQDTARLMQQAVATYREAQFEDGVEFSFDNPEVWLAQQKEERFNALTTGLPLLDQALLGSFEEGSPQVQGGLQRGDTTVILAPSNTGKTTCMLTIGRHNVLASKDVLLMTHEGRPEDIRSKMMKAALGMTEQQMLSLYSTPAGQEMLRRMAAWFKRHLVYIPYNKAGMKVEDVVPIIRRAVEDKIARTGRGFDLLISDYPAKLTTEQARGSLAMRNVVEIVYDHYVQLALEYKFHSLLAIQTNREGSKVNAGLNSNRLLMMEDVMEAWGPMTSASNVITLNRSPTAKKKHRITLYVAKSRSSETGIAVVARSNFACGLTHAANMGAVAYLGNSTMENNIDMFFQTHLNQMIPQNLVR